MGAQAKVLAGQERGDSMASTHAPANRHTSARCRPFPAHCQNFLAPHPSIPLFLQSFAAGGDWILTLTLLVLVVARMTVSTVAPCVQVGCLSTHAVWFLDLAILTSVFRVVVQEKRFRQLERQSHAHTGERAARVPSHCRAGHPPHRARQAPGWAGGPPAYGGPGGPLPGRRQRTPVWFAKRRVWHPSGFT